tara:strand:- start:2999 stop:3307 length:309 start_codon:yes stop_codon:yes gene_type:complete
MTEIPTFKMSASFILKDDFEMYLSKNHDLFFRRIIEHINNRIDSTERDDLLCWILDEEYDEKLELRLPNHGFKKALEKAMNYFENIEEYETCHFINDLKKQI